MSPSNESAVVPQYEQDVPLLKTYAKRIDAAVEAITTYCASEGLPQPSFDPRAPCVTLPSTAPLAVQDARQDLIASAARIQHLVTEPAEYLPSLQIHVRLSQLILLHVPLRECLLTGFLVPHPFMSSLDCTIQNPQPYPSKWLHSLLGSGQSCGCA